MVTTDRARRLRVVIALITTSLFAGLRLPAQSGTPAGPRIPAVAVRQARTLGKTRVIVHLDVAVAPEPLAGPAALFTQRAAIARGQDAVLGRMLRVHPGSVRRFSYIPFLALEVDEGDLATLAAAPDVTGIEIDALARPTLAESTPLIGATRAWAAGFTGAGWTVAVLDTGIDKTHPFLAGKVVSEGCYSSTIPGRSSSACPGGAASSTAPGSGLPCAMNGCDHGTHVAGIAAGQGTAFSGVAPDASLIAIQVFSAFGTTDDCGSSAPPCALSFTSDQILGLERVYALRRTFNIAAVNMSLGGGLFTSPCDSRSTKAIIDQLRAAGIATVIAAGNDGSTTALAAPACISSAISVASTTDGTGTSPDRVSYFSNTNPFLSLFAPGETILSSIPGGRFANFNGTSMAAPHVAGAWALMKSKRPSATVPEILDALTATGTAILNRANGITKPRVNVDMALQILSAPCTYVVNPTHVDVGPQSGNVVVSVNTQANCPWTATSLSSFIPVPSGQAGSGPGTVLIVYSMNSNRFTRDGVVVIAGTTVLISQQGRPAPTDVTGYGRADLFWQNVADGGLATWHLDGWKVTSTLSLGISRVSDTNWRVVGSGDLNGDGRADLVWQHQTEGWLAVWYLAANQVLSTQFLSIDRIADLNWQVKGVDDIDGDGKADIIWQHHTEGWLAAWLMDGARVTTTRFLSISQMSDAQWQIAGAGDTNGDGYADLVWRHQTDGWLAVWYMRGTEVIGTRFLSTNRVADLNWQIRGVGDTDGDGRADLVWQNDVTGGLALWQLNGVTVFGETSLSIERVPDTNWKIVGPG